MYVVVPDPKGVWGEMMDAYHVLVCLSVGRSVSHTFCPGGCSSASNHQHPLKLMKLMKLMFVIGHMVAHGVDLQCNDILTLCPFKVIFQIGEEDVMA